MNDIDGNNAMFFSSAANVTINGGGHASTGGLSGIATVENISIDITSENGMRKHAINMGNLIRNVNINYNNNTRNSYHVVGTNDGAQMENVNINAKGVSGIRGVSSNGDLNIKNLTMDLSVENQGSVTGVYTNSGNINVDGMSIKTNNENAVGIDDTITQISVDEINKTYGMVKSEGPDASFYQEEFNKIISEYDKLISDVSYQGINLLTGGELKVTFNESRTNDILIKGQDIRSEKIGLNKSEWSSSDKVKESIKEVQDTIDKLRSFADSLGNNYQIIQTRQNFTEALSDVLEEGADKLILADMNEASAEYLMLQTRQQLAVNSLSLASQSASSTLSLF